MAQLRYECSHCAKLSCNHTAAVQHNRDAHGGQANILPERSKSQMRANDFAQRAKIANLTSQCDAYRAMALKVEDAEVVAHERWLEIERLRASQADAGAVMVWECRTQIERWSADLRDKRTIGQVFDALSTLSPIAAAARVLLASDAALTELAITTMRANRLNDGKRIGYQPALEVGLRALAEQEKADG